MSPFEMGALSGFGFGAVAGMVVGIILAVIGLKILSGVQGS